MFPADMPDDRDVDLIVVGAGPAGMAAATVAAEAGAKVILLDEQGLAGGQIYRDVERVAEVRGDLLGPDYVAGRELTKRLATPGLTHIRNAAVWMVEVGYRVTYSVGQTSYLVQAPHLILASGAIERPMPLPGWTLPGVMTAGAAQILIKQSGLALKRSVLVGSGPLLYLVASQLTRAGTPPIALLETQTRSDFLVSLRHVVGALRGWRYLVKGLSMLSELRRAGVKRYVGVTDVSISGVEFATGVRFKYRGRSRELNSDAILLHHGVVPNTQIARSIGVSHKWNEQGHYFSPVIDAWGECDQAGVFIVGDSAGIGGAQAAAVNGRIAALRVLYKAGRISENILADKASVLRAQLRKEMAVRPFLDSAYPPALQALMPSDSTVVCRCEEVTAGDIRGYAQLGCIGPNQAKAFGRCGMGPCQGRQCGLSVTGLLATAHNMPMDEVGYQRIRAPLKPVTLQELASIAVDKPLAMGEASHG
jgi:NADPH-dependent 2,4-dienoyl-CoA reductase/sulfur reductase-like enzyme